MVKKVSNSEYIECPTCREKTHKKLHEIPKSLVLIQLLEATKNINADHRSSNNDSNINNNMIRSQRPPPPLPPYPNPPAQIAQVPSSYTHSVNTNPFATDFEYMPSNTSKNSYNFEKNNNKPYSNSNQNYNVAPTSSSSSSGYIKINKLMHLILFS
jgi:hypothetical protein